MQGGLYTEAEETTQLQDWNRESSRKIGELEEQDTKETVSVPSVTKVSWIGKGAIRSGDYRMCYPRGESAQ
jgi:hypothetical protein